MSTQGDWPPDPDDRSHQRDPWEERAPRRPGMSTGAKVLIVLLSLAGVVVLLCCGVGLYIASSFQLDENPAAVAGKTGEIVQIEIPEVFVPRGTVSANLIVFSIDGVVYETEGDPQGTLMLGEFKGLGMDNADVRTEIRRAMRRPDGGDELKITRSETREFEVRGERVDFTFAEATDNAGNEYRLVMGSFPTDDGQGILSVEMPAEIYDEEAIVEMIESIE